MIPDIAAWKKAARAEARARRDACDPAAGQEVVKRLLAEVPPAPGAVVGGVWPLAGEMDLRGLLETLAERGHRIGLPVAGGLDGPMVFRHWTPATRMVAGRFGTMHTDEAELLPDYVLVPLLAFDRRGHRLGYGKGYYDRTLAALPGATAVGFAFACQEMESLRVDPWDRALDAIVTEREVIRPEHG